MLARKSFHRLTCKIILTGTVCAIGFGGQAFAADPNATVFVDLTAANGTIPADSGETSHVTVIGNLTIIGDFDPEKTLFVDLTTMPGTEVVVHAPPLQSAPAGPLIDANDPYEATNRRFFRSHLALQRNVITPVEQVYIDTVPEPVRGSLHNFLVNLEFPPIFINDLLQFDPGRAGATFARFVVNSTAGVGGLLDVAGMLGVPFRDNDFGATLSNYGVGDYPYLMIPVIGPTNPRDLSGKAVDVLLNPLHFVTLPGGILTEVGQSGLHELDTRSENLNELDGIAKTSPDAYVSVRSLARQRRNAEIGGVSHDRNYLSAAESRN
jgi:phospholipid-binding lipoprotein MlaA